MGIENLTNNSIANIPFELIQRVEILITIFQAVGWMVIFYLVFSVINTIMNRKKNKEITQINKNLEEIKKILQRKK